MIPYAPTSLLDSLFVSIVNWHPEHSITTALSWSCPVLGLRMKCLVPKVRLGLEFAPKENKLRQLIKFFLGG